MKNFNRATLDLATNYSHAIVIDSGFVAERPDEFSAFSRQSKRDPNHDLILSWELVRPING
jgi:hypothetical protein